MKRFFKWLLTVVGVVAAIFIIGGFLIPKQWTVARQIVIGAPVEDIYVQVANLKNWQNWAPWNLEKDPTQVYTYEGPEIGVGAKWLWTSEKMGKGYLEVKEANPKTGITYELFIDMNGMQSTMKGVMVFKEQSGDVEVLWTDHGDAGSNLMKRWMSLLIGKMLGEEMESGLNKLKEVVETKKPEANAEPDAEADVHAEAEDIE